VRVRTPAWQAMSSGAVWKRAGRGRAGQATAHQGGAACLLCHCWLHRLLLRAIHQGLSLIITYVCDKPLTNHYLLPALAWGFFLFGLCLARAPRCQPHLHHEPKHDSTEASAACLCACLRACLPACTAVHAMQPASAWPGAQLAAAACSHHPAAHPSLCVHYASSDPALAWTSWVVLAPIWTIGPPLSPWQVSLPLLGDPASTAGTAGTAHNKVTGYVGPPAALLEPPGTACHSVLNRPEIPGRVCSTAQHSTARHSRMAQHGTTRPLPLHRTRLACTKLVAPLRRGRPVVFIRHIGIELGAHTGWQHIKGGLPEAHGRPDGGGQRQNVLAARLPGACC